MKFNVIRKAMVYGMTVVLTAVTVSDIPAAGIDKNIGLAFIGFQFAVL